jgi:hypothetical protein
MASRARPQWQILALVTALAILYLAFPTLQYQFDAVSYASAALHGDSWIASDPGHLAYGHLEVVAADLGRKARPPLSPILLLQYLSMAGGIAGAYAFYRTLKNLGASASRATAFAGILCCTYGYWHYALQAESHILSTAFLLLFLEAFSRLLRAPSGRAAAWLGVLLGMATLMHQQNVLIAGPALVALPFAARGRRQLVAVASSFMAAYGALVVLPYVTEAIGILGLRTVPQVGRWITGLAGWGEWGHWTRVTLFQSATGFARCLVGGHFLLQLGFMRSFAQAHGAWVVDKLPLAEAVPPALATVLAALTAALFGLGLIAVARRAGRLGRLTPRHASLIVFLLAWLVIRTGFAAWWAPRLVEFWIDLFPPLLMLLAIPLGEDDRSGDSFRLAGAFAITLAVVNFVGSIQPEARPTIDPETRIAIALDATVNRNEVVLTDSPLNSLSSHFARSMKKVDLLDRPATGAVPERETQFAVVDSLLAAADSVHRVVYLVATPLSPTEARRAVHRDLVTALAARYDVTERVPIRAEVDLRRVRRR